MGKFIYTILYSFILACSLLYIWHKLQNKKIDFKNKRLYVTLLGITIISIFNYFLVNKFIKIVLITIVFMIFFRYLFKESIQKTIITPIYYQLLIMISETIYALSITIIFKINPQNLLNTDLGFFITNTVIAIISIFLINFKPICICYKLILNLTDKIKKFSLITLCFILILLANIFAMTTYYKIEYEYLLIFNVSVTLVCFMIVIISLRAQNKYNKVSDKYDVAINSLTDYEEMMSKYRIANHENKNLLLTVRAMILNKEKDIPKYIDSLVKEKFEDNEKLLLQMNVIPSGGLRATIYSEILKIKDNGIDYSLNIDKNLKTIDLIELDTDDIIDVCKIVCVFIDNAIEEVKSLKTKNIDISMYLDNNILNIKVSNNYKGKINVDKIFDEGYTTKGKGHGYGLALVKEIVNNNKSFKNNTEISKDIFSQILSIKIKKHIS